VFLFIQISQLPSHPIQHKCLHRRATGNGQVPAQMMKTDMNVVDNNRGKGLAPSVTQGDVS